MSWPRALWAGFLSLILPGLGQYYGGAQRLGIVLFLASVGLAICWIIFSWHVAPTPAAIVAFTVATLGFPLAVAIDAVRRARRAPRSSPPWYRSTWVAAIVMILINVGLRSIDLIGHPPGWRSFHIASGSSLPTLLTTDYVMVDVSHPGTTPAYGDIIVFNPPKQPNVEYVKRVVGLPGDRVQLRDGTLYLNGQAISREPQGPARPDLSAPPMAGAKQFRETLPNGRSYTTLELAKGYARDTPEYTVPADRIFVLGDNRDNSLDSREPNIGLIPIANIVGTVRTVYWAGFQELNRFLLRVQ
jgi:signal peptidase I